MRTRTLLTLGILLAASLVVAPAATADPLDVRTGPCPEGEGMTLDVNGQRVQDCQPPIVWRCDGGVSVAGHCARLGAAPEAGVRVCHGHNPGLQAWALGFDTGCMELARPPALDSTDRPFPVEACGGRGELGVQVVDPLAPTPCIPILRVTPCPFGDGYEVEFAGNVQVGDCDICCPPPGPAAGTDFPVRSCGELAFEVVYGPIATQCIQAVEVYYCPGGGGYLVILGLVQTGHCTPCCDLAGSPDAPPEVEVRPCVPRGVRVYVDDQPVTPCIGTNGPPVEVDARCNHPDNGVQVRVLGFPTTRCYPLPHGV